MTMESKLLLLLRLALFSVFLPMPAQAQEKMALIEIGSESIKLAVAEVDSSSYKLVDPQSLGLNKEDVEAYTGIGVDLGTHSGIVQASTLDKCIKSVQKLIKTAEQRFAARDVFLSATASFRDAKNREEMEESFFKTSAKK